VIKLPLLVDLQQKLGELFRFITSCPTIIILENSLNLRIEKKCGYGNFDHRYVSPLRLHTFLTVENFRKVVRVEVVRDCRKTLY
jgi:hypothetical protein